MSLSKLRKQIRVALNVTPQAVSARIAKQKKLHAPVSDEVATALAAHQVGIDITKFVEADTVDRVRILARPNGAGVKMAKTRTPQSRPRSITRNVYVGKELKIQDPLLTPKLLAEAKEMAEKVYPLIYVFENSVRQFIIRVLEDAKGSAWWTMAAPPDVQKTVTTRQQKEARNPWHGRRGAHEIFYCDVGDLRKIVITNWPDFKDFLPDQAWFTVRIGEIESSRNIVSHNNPLSKNDVQRVEVYARDWHRQMSSFSW